MTTKTQQADTVTQFATTLGFPEPVQIGDGVYACICDIKPDIAKLILEEHAAINRRKKQHAIRQYIKDMRHAKWSLTGQAVCFNSNNEMFDGQNRLRSCVESGCKFRTVVMFNLPPSSQINTDGGVKRSHLDIATISGLELRGKDCGVARSIAYGGNPPKCTQNQFLLIVGVLDESLSFLGRQFPKNVPLTTIVPVLGAIGRAYYHVNEIRLSELCSILRDQVHGGYKKDEAGAKLLRWLIGFRGRGASSNIEIFSKTLYAIDRFIAGRPIPRLLAKGDDLYPLPEEIEDQIAQY